MEAIVEAEVIDAQHLKLRQPVPLPPGSSLLITIDLATATSAGCLSLPPDPPHELQVFAFGPARILSGGVAIGASSWKYLKARELLFFLLCQRPLTKEQIGAALWPDATPAHMATSFRVALYYLRRALGDSQWILYENKQYAFNRSLPYWFDVETFQRNVTEARTRFVAGLRDQTPIRLLQSATDLYAGPFLEGCPAGDWQCQLRQELECEYVNALLLLGELRVTEGQYTQALEQYLKVLAVNAYREVAHRGLMRCYAWLGEYGAALRHYHLLADLLRSELGAAPSPETRTLYDQLLQDAAG
jgi:DNA-binding SARP family transcriptional activator